MCKEETKQNKSYCAGGGGRTTVYAQTGKKGHVHNAEKTSLKPPVHFLGGGDGASKDNQLLML